MYAVSYNALLNMKHPTIYKSNNTGKLWQMLLKNVILGMKIVYDLNRP